MERVIIQIHELLVKKHKTIAVAESCTGGLLSSLLTSLDGSSQYFILGAVVYSNKAKSSILGIPGSLINNKGAVCAQVTALMAKGVRKLAHTDFGIGISGIAGPGGGSKTKPVGTVFIAVEGKSKKTCRKFIFKGSRSSVRKKSALKSLELLRSFL
ncbi:MAG: nicotinamide-nucleotide amidohydrolase family protein [Candidatus Omnitrophica bacterium]|nr:nicotinamide-nucleotide amidohydrolase family protein [Candidatus Omnitrophota bacterium]